MTGEQRRIFLRGLKVKADIGIHDFERGNPQALTIDIDVWLDPIGGGFADEIEHTLDYDTIRTGVVELVRARRYNLQETLVHAILDLCMAQRDVVEARVSTAKTEVYPDVDAVGYEATRTRAR
jgi:dihydroneopterin aldolase